MQVKGIFNYSPSQRPEFEIIPFEYTSGESTWEAPVHPYDVVLRAHSRGGLSWSCCESCKRRQGCYRRNCCWIVKYVRLRDWWYGGRNDVSAGVRGYCDRIMEIYIEVYIWWCALDVGPASKGICSAPWVARRSTCEAGWMVELSEIVDVCGTGETERMEEWSKFAVTGSDPSGCVEDEARKSQVSVGHSNVWLVISTTTFHRCVM